PARSGGAVLTIRSVVSPKIGARPSDTTSEATTTMARPLDVEVVTWLRITRPTAATANPPLMRWAGLTRRTIRGPRFDATMNPMASGSDHRPAANGDRPRTSWRYCATKRK